MRKCGPSCQFPTYPLEDLVDCDGPLCKGKKGHHPACLDDISNQCQECVEASKKPPAEVIVRDGDDGEEEEEDEEFPVLDEIEDEEEEEEEEDVASSAASGASSWLKCLDPWEAHRGRVESISRQAVWWKVFHTFKKMDKEFDENSASCNICGQILTRGKSKSPTTIKNHLLHKHKQVFAQLAAMAKEKKKGAEPSPSMSSTATRGSGLITDYAVALKNKEQYSAEIKAAMAMWLIDDDVPFRKTENKWFRQVLELTAEAGWGKAYFTPNYVSMKEEAATLEHVLLNDLKPVLKKTPLVLTMDHWTAKTKDQFSGTTAHWIDGVHAKSAVLDFKVKEFAGKGSSTAEAMLEELEKDMLVWDIKLSAGTVPFIVTDTEAAMNLFGMHIEEKHEIVSYCTDHSIQLTTNIAMEWDFGTEEGSAKNLMEKTRAFVTYFNSSMQMVDELKSIQKWFDNNKEREPVVLKGDSKTCWWSSFDMIKRKLY